MQKLILKELSYLSGGKSAFFVLAERFLIKNFIIPKGIEE